jgi:hypothetical protein
VEPVEKPAPMSKLYGEDECDCCVEKMSVAKTKKKIRDIERKNRAKKRK